MVMKSLSSIYKLIVQARHKVYSANIKSAKKLELPVVVIGNITVGGTGKTPFVNFVIQLLNSKGLLGGVISRGYGGNYSGVTSVNLAEPFPAKRFGDEPTLLKVNNPKTPIYLCADRYKAGKSLIDDNKDVSAIICDDGFQHFGLQRNLNVVLIDCTEDINNYQMLPKGRLREPLQGLARANFIVFTKSNWASKQQVSDCKKLVNQYYPLTESNHAVAEYKSSFPELEHNNVLLVSSIAKPQFFKENIKNSDLYNIKEHLVFKDHHNFTSKDVNNIFQEYNYSKCDWILTTEKDLVKLNQFDKLKSKLQTVNISIDLVSGKESFERELFKVFN